MLNTSTDRAIAVKDLKKSYGKLKVLDGIDFEVHRGEILALLGPNGAGKTTIVRILSTLLSQDEGTATVNGFDVRREPGAVRSSIGLTGQYAAVDEYLTGRENLEMIGLLYRLGEQETKNRSQKLLERLDLVEPSNRRVKTYSGGMRRRIDLAMSLIASPSILFLDEPTTGLDPHSRITMWEIIKGLAATNVTVLLTTQYMEEADRLADKIIVIDKGSVIAQGTPTELKASIGPDHLEIIVKDDDDFLNTLKLFETDVLQNDPKRRSLSIITKNGTADLKKVLSMLEESKIIIDSLSLHRPTLDDVFLALTGHSTSVEAERQTNASTTL
ncbi:MAG: ATP-binding cassette domain-containing protein [Patescibacteria group bacterium]|nr:ATP-binding cassette domain-containing protein [Patescibacteria group bacterium]